MGIFTRIGDKFYNAVMRHMENSPPRKATKEESARTKELMENYDKWAKLPGGTTDENKDEGVK